MLCPSQVPMTSGSSSSGVGHFLTSSLSVVRRLTRFEPASEVPVPPEPLEQVDVIGQAVEGFVHILRRAWRHDIDGLSSDQIREDDAQLLERCLESKRFLVGFEVNWLA